MSSVYRLSAEMVLNADKAIFSLKGVQGILDRLINTGGSAGATFAGVSRNLAKAVGSAVLARKELGLYLSGLQAAREEAREAVPLRVAVTWEGDTPDDIEARIARMDRLSANIGLGMGRDPDEVRDAIARTIDPLMGEEGMSGGLAKWGARFGEATAIGFESGIRGIKSQLSLFEMPFDEANTERMANMLYRTQRLAGGEGGMEEFLGNLRRGATSAKIAGARPEDAALLLAALSRTKPERAGMAMSSFYDALNPSEPKKRWLMRRYGFGGMFDKQGNLAGLEDIDRAFDSFRRKFPKTAERNRKIAEIFGDSADALIEVFNTYDFAKLKAARDRAAGLEAFEGAQEQTLDRQIGRTKAIKKEMTENLFAPAERWAAGFMRSLNAPAEGFMNLSKNKTMQELVSWGGAGAIGATGLATLIFGGRAFKGIKGGLADLGGFKGLFASLTKAKALEKSAGVQPVFVVNANELGRGFGGEVGRMMTENESGARLLNLAGGSDVPVPTPKGFWKSFLTGGNTHFTSPTAATLIVGTTILEHFINQATEAQDTADRQRQLALDRDPVAVARMIEENRRRRGERAGLSQEQIDADVAAARDRAAYRVQGSSNSFLQDTWEGNVSLYGGLGKKIFRWLGLPEIESGFHHGEPTPPTMPNIQEREAQVNREIARQMQEAAALQRQAAQTMVDVSNRIDRNLDGRGR